MYLGSHGGGSSSSTTPSNPDTNGKDKDSSDKKHIKSASDSTPMNVRIRKQRTQMGQGDSLERILKDVLEE
ncbi:MAG: hypothetical protein ACJ704_05650 [Nitrososphaeraceae archaeon]